MSKTIELIDPYTRLEDEEPYFCVAQGLVPLLNAGVLWVRDKQYMDGGDASDGLIILASANDVFMWGCADAEEVTEEDVRVLYDGYIAEKPHYADEWACKKRNMQPQPPLKRMMQAAGAWTIDLENLPANPFEDEWTDEDLEEYGPKPDEDNL